MSDPMQEQDIRMDADNLCREDVFTDNRVGTVRRLTPVTANGEVDPDRPVQYIGSTQIMTPAGALPLSFELPNESLEAAVAGFGDAAREAVDKTMEELRELQRQAASQIVVPKGGMDPGSMGGGGVPGGGIQLP
ncbi:MAG: hypothetical protein V2I57_13435 [Xanthomonadales bacterium]|nr:hypothetical protein [Xanthomonadales bacterium]